MPATGGIDQAHGLDRARLKHDAERASWRSDFIQAGLARIIEGEILPRLTQAHVEVRSSQAEPAICPTPERVAAFARACMGHGPSDEQVRALMEEGLPLATLLLDLLAPAARHLGLLWERDEADFIDVTAALGRLHGLARTLCEHMEQPRVLPNAGRILLVPCPGETHLFSLALVASFFREAGWYVVLLTSEAVDPREVVRGERFDIIGVSLSCDVYLPAMADLLTALRAISRNPDIRTLVGGPLFLRDPDSATVIGADAAAEDGRSAVRIAEALLNRQSDEADKSIKPYVG